MQTKNLDVVYVLGTGSRFDNNEIRLSLRSIEKNLSHRNVFIVGEKLAWFKTLRTGLKTIKMDDVGDDKLINTREKLKKVCNHKDLSDDFILMNDDFFIMKPTHDIKPEHRDKLKSSYKKHPSQKGYYAQAMKDTIDFLYKNGIKEPLDFSLHRPFIFNKKKLLKVIELMEQDGRQLLTRTIYGNMEGIKGTKKKDVKIKSVQDFEDPFFIENDVISTTDAIVKRKAFRCFMHPHFYKQSKYEKF
jgi:hypothetical protein